MTEPGPSLAGRRVLALAAAAAMVGGAWVVRDRVLDDGEGGSGNGPVRVVCVTELADACEALARQGDVTVRVEPAGTTAAALTAAADGAVPDFEGWLTLDPWPAIVEEARARAGAEPVLDDPEGPLARSPLVLAVRADRAGVLAERCPDGIGWRCLGEVAGRTWRSLGGDATWGTVKPAHPNPATGAAAALLVGQAVAHYLAATVPDLAVGEVSRSDWENHDGFAAWFQRLERAVPNGGFEPPAGSPFAQLLLTRVAYDVVGTLEAEAGPALARAADLRDDLTVVYPAPMSTADVVLAPVRGAAAGALTGAVTGDAGRAALAAAGWRVDGEPHADGVPASPALPRGTGLPSAGAIDALRALWEEVVR